jgi:hypothetical protein
MPAIPPFILKKLYVRGSLQAEEEGFTLALRNTIAPGTILGLKGIELDGRAVPLERVTVALEAGDARPIGEVSSAAPLSFPVGATFHLRVAGVQLEPGPHNLKINVVVGDVGPLEIPVADQVR